MPCLELPSCGRVLETKAAVSVMAAFMVTEDELLLPEYEPLPLPVQMLKL